MQSSNGSQYIGWRSYLKHDWDYLHSGNPACDNQYIPHQEVQIEAEMQMDGTPDNEPLSAGPGEENGFDGGHQ